MNASDPAQVSVEPLEQVNRSILNSSMGRFLVFCVSGLLYACICFGAIFCQEPKYVANGISNVIILVTIMACALYALLPHRMAEWANMNTKSTWKPYLCLWHLSFFVAPVGISFLSYGYGSLAAFGSFGKYENVNAVIPMDEGNPFAAYNAFVALNLTKAYIQTLIVDPMDNLTNFVPRYYNATDQNGEVLERITVHQATKFREVKYFKPTNPLIEGPMLPLPVDTMFHYIAAPIFANYANCLARFRATSVCQTRNKIIGWAVATRNSTCSRIGFVKCLEQELKIQPMEGCLTDTKLCGRIVRRPNKILVELIVDSHVDDGWGFYGGTPDEIKEDVKPTVIFVDANHDDCIMDQEGCKKTWGKYGLIGLILSCFTGLLIILAALLDCFVDYQLRLASQYLHYD